MTDMNTMMLTDEALEAVNAGYIHCVHDEYGGELWEVINDKDGKETTNFYSISRESAEYWAREYGQSPREISDKQLMMLRYFPCAIMIGK